MRKLESVICFKDFYLINQLCFIKIEQMAYLFRLCFQVYFQEQFTEVSLCPERDEHVGQKQPCADTKLNL